MVTRRSALPGVAGAAGRNRGRQPLDAGSGAAACAVAAVHAALLAAAALSLGGCATRPTNGSSASPVESPHRSPALYRLAAGRPGPLAVGTVQPSSGADAPPDGFARALREVLVRDLKAIGVFDAAAPTRLDVVVVSPRRGAAGVEAQVTVTRAGQPRLNKRYRAEPSAAPVDESNAVQSLLGELYDDPEFNLAVKD